MSFFGSIRDFFRSGLQVYYVAGLNFVRHAPDLWLLAALGTVPLFAATFRQHDYEVAVIALAFAVIWARLFRDARVFPDLKPYWLPMAAVLCPVIISIPFFSLISFSPGQNQPPLISWARGASVVSFFGCIFLLGLPQECFKLVPSLLYIAWKGSSATAADLLAIGVFAGLGFGAAIFVLAPAHPIKDMGDQSLSLFVSPFLNAALGGFVSCHLGLAQRQFWPSLTYTTFGLAAAALLFGLFLWFLQIQVLIAALIAALAAFLFFALARVVIAASHTLTVDDSDVVSF